MLRRAVVRALEELAAVGERHRALGAGYSTDASAQLLSALLVLRSMSAIWRHPVLPREQYPARFACASLVLAAGPAVLQIISIGQEGGGAEDAAGLLLKAQCDVLCGLLELAATDEAGGKLLARQHVPPDALAAWVGQVAAALSTLKLPGCPQSECCLLQRCAALREALLERAPRRRQAWELVLFRRQLLPVCVLSPSHSPVCAAQ